MRKIVLFVLTLALGCCFPCYLLGQESLIYTQDFGAAAPTGWTTAVVAGSPWGFSFYSTDYAYRLPADNTYCMRIPTDGTTATNSWAFMQGIPMTAGYSYRVEFCQRVLSSYAPENLRVTVGNAPNVAAQTEILWDKANMTFTDYYNRTTKQFVPATTGTYYFAFQCYSPAGRQRIYVDNVRVWQKTNTPPSTPGMWRNGKPLWARWSAIPGGCQTKC